MLGILSVPFSISHNIVSQDKKTLKIRNNCEDYIKMCERGWMPLRIVASSFMGGRLFIDR